VLKGFRVLITGATSGLGAAMAGALAGAGARVMVTGRDQNRTASAAKELGSSVIPCQLDVRDERSVAECVARARDAWGGIDMLVNNAGIGMRTVNPRFLSEPQPFWAVTPTGFRDVMETKVVGCFLMAREVVPLMLSQGSGRIVNISMNEETMIRRGFVPYGPAGAGVEALSRIMAADLEGSSVTVNILLPGGRGTLTGMVPSGAAVRPRSRGIAIFLAWSRRCCCSLTDGRHRCLVGEAVGVRRRSALAADVAGPAWWVQYRSVRPGAAAAPRDASSPRRPRLLPRRSGPSGARSKPAPSCRATRALMRRTCCKLRAMRRGDERPALERAMPWAPR
jgi:NAD(P)-dependent dehydrogenase (short-subunit alcohol dehydrogenase family)